uniref:Uncharacterized protein n=1 Tax=Cannabis sativa TaxID=3483 RepID=A0A803QSP3_CANSA
SFTLGTFPLADLQSSSLNIATTTRCAAVTARELHRVLRPWRPPIMGASTCPDGR